MRDIVLVLGVLLSIWFLYRSRNFQSVVIVSLQTVSTLMMFFCFLYVVGYVVFTVSLLLMLIYPMSVKGSVRKKISVIFLITVPIFLIRIYTLFDYPSFSLLKLAMFLPLIGLMLALIRYENFKKEIAFLVLPSVYSLFMLFDYFRVFT